MKKFARIVYLLAMAALIFSMSGCGGGSSGGGGDSSNGQNQTAGDRLMVVSSPVLKQGESYHLYRGRSVSARFNDDSNPMNYVAPITPGQNVTMNLTVSSSVLHYSSSILLLSRLP